MKELHTALGNIQNLGLTAKKDTSAYNYKYADLEQILTILREHLKDTGLLVIQEPMRDVLKTTVVHITTGQSTFSETPLLTAETSKNAMQDLGGSVTYARRYALCSMFNIITNDDDNASATQDTPSKTSGPKPTDKQLDLARSLLEKAGYKPEAISKRLADIGTSAEASALIAKLFEKKEAKLDQVEFDSPGGTPF